MTQELRQAWQNQNEIIIIQNFLSGSSLFMSSPRFIQHTFADARSISEDPGCVLGEPKILNGDGAQLSLNQAKTKHWKHLCEYNERGEKSGRMCKHKLTNLLSSL